MLIRGINEQLHEHGMTSDITGRSVFVNPQRTSTQTHDRVDPSSGIGFPSGIPCTRPLSHDQAGGTQADPRAKKAAEILTISQGYFRALDEVRRGICFVNAGRFQEAERAFSTAKDLGMTGPSLASRLAASLLGQRRYDEAARQFAAIQSGTGVGTARIRESYALREAGRLAEAIAVLRDAVAAEPSDPEVHFQLGTLLATCDAFDEAELRFTQALNLDPSHVEASVSLALCFGLRGIPGTALKYLQQAQIRKPLDGRIGFLLAQAADAVRQRGQVVKVKAIMPAMDLTEDRQGIEELSRVIEVEPDFVDAFLSIPIGEVDETVFAMLLKTIERALERQPEHAELHFHCGRVLDRLGHQQAAIDATERAVGLAPQFTKALIELAKLYQRTDRDTDATTRLEEAIAAGAEYADVYYLLGNLYRDQGHLGQARQAYRQALTINERFEAAQQALAALPA